MFLWCLFNKLSNTRHTASLEKDTLTWAWYPPLEIFSSRRFYPTKVLRYVNILKHFSRLLVDLLLFTLAILTAISSFFWYRFILASHFGETNLSFFSAKKLEFTIKLLFSNLAPIFLKCSCFSRCSISHANASSLSAACSDSSMLLKLRKWEGRCTSW